VFKGRDTVDTENNPVFLPISRQCRSYQNSRHLEDGNDLFAPNALIEEAIPFGFSTVNLDVPFIFYIMAPIFAFVLMISPFLGGDKHWFLYFADFEREFPLYPFESAEITWLEIRLTLNSSISPSRGCLLPPLYLHGQ